MELRATEDLLARKQKPLPEMFVSKSTAGAGFEVLLELKSLSIVLKPDGYCLLPWRIL